MLPELPAAFSSDPSGKEGHEASTFVLPPEPAVLDRFSFVDSLSDEHAPSNEEVTMGRNRSRAKVSDEVWKLTVQVYQAVVFAKRASSSAFVTCCI